MITFAVTQYTSSKHRRCVCTVLSCVPVAESTPPPPPCRHSVVISTRQQSVVNECSLFVVTPTFKDFHLMHSATWQPDLSRTKRLDQSRKINGTYCSLLSFPLSPTTRVAQISPNLLSSTTEVRCAGKHGGAQEFSLAGVKNKRPKTESGSRVIGEGQQPPPHQLGDREERYELPQWGSGRSPDRPKVFHYFQHWLASPDTIILLIVDYHAATGGARPPCPLLAYAPASKQICV